MECVCPPGQTSSMRKHSLVVVFGGLLVHRCLAVVAGLLDLVLHGIAGGVDAGRSPDIGVFGDLLVGFFARRVRPALGLVGDVVSS